MKNVGIVAFAFGVPYTIKSNILLAEIASKNACEFNAPVYTQRDIRLMDGIEVEYIEEDNGNPPSTLQIARGAIQWAKRKRLVRLMIVAAKPHLWRVLRDLNRAVDEDNGVPQIRIYICDEVSDSSEDYWFCSDSIQKRVRSRDEWNKRERILKILPFFIYKRIAS